MANVAITDLTELLSVNSNDVIPIVNVGANITQKVTADTLQTFIGLGGNLTGNLEGNGFGAANLTSLTSTGNITAGGRLVAAGALFTTTVNMNNSSITNINGLQIADAGRNEGILWNDTYQWAIFDSTNNFTNTSGNLQFTSGNTVDPGNTAAYTRITFNTSGQIEIPVATGTAPLKINSTTEVANLNAEFLGGFDSSQTDTANTVVVRTSSGAILANNVSVTNTVQLGVYANAAVRDSSITSPSPGMMIYVTGVGMQVRGATAWNTVAGTGT